jgi:hypothetical protein
MSRPTEVVLDYWDSARKSLLGDPKLIQRLLEYDKDNMDPRIVDTITASFINNPLFNPEVIRKVGPRKFVAWGVDPATVVPIPWWQPREFDGTAPCCA